MRFGDEMVVHQKIKQLEKDLASAKINLRDQFAMSALQGLLANPFDVDELTGDAIKHFAGMSYEYADAMLEARKDKTNGE